MAKKEDKKPKVMTVSDAQRVFERLTEDGGTIKGRNHAKKINEARGILKTAGKWGEFVKGKDGKITMKVEKAAAK